MIKVLRLTGGLVPTLFLLLSAACSAPSKRDILLSISRQVSVLKNDSAEVAGDLVLNPDLVEALYRKENSPVLARWGDKQKVDQLISEIENVELEGLRPEDYHLVVLKELREKVFYSDNYEAEDVAKMEVLLTDALVLMASHLQAGKTDPATVDPQWQAVRRESAADLLPAIDSALSGGDISGFLGAYLPAHREYLNLRKGLSRYRKIRDSGGWPQFPAGNEVLQLKVKHPDVAFLRRRLMISQGGAENYGADSLTFDQHLHEQVKIFQKRNGLDTSGVVTEATIATLNIPVEERIATIEANLERWRWLKDDLGKKHIKVNIADFLMGVVENNTTVLRADAIVGKPYRKTPVFSATMTYLVLSPSWTVPPTILKNDVLPAVRKNRAYLKQKGMLVLKNDGSVVDPSAIDWKGTSGKFPYQIKQKPGKDNALGVVKFMFPNKYNVYIHDTPQRNLFAHTDRSFSSGCIRISEPLTLAEYLLQDKKEWTRERMEKVIASGKETTVTLNEPVQVHVIYLTAWADDNGTVHFRKDVYGRDEALLRALKEAPPGAAVKGIASKN